jgi:hypothetical protein
MHDATNPYAPPQAEGAAPRSARETAASQYFAPSTAKVAVLGVATLGLYQTYWLYRQWKAVRARRGEDLSPFWRAVFDVIFVGRLFRVLRAEVEGAEVRTTGDTGTLIIGFIVVEILSRAAARMDSGWLWLLGVVSVVPIVILQGEINQLLARRDPHGPPPEGFGVGAVVALVLGVLSWGLIILGLLAA